MIMKKRITQLLFAILSAMLSTVAMAQYTEVEPDVMFYDIPLTNANIEETGREDPSPDFV